MHPEADAFLDAIFDHPDDDTPRLVYADWLQEHGQENYARFIRLQCAAARATPFGDEANRLWEEIGRVWNRLCDAWWLPLRGGDWIDACHFCRGFLESGYPLSADDLPTSSFLWKHPELLACVSIGYTDGEPLVFRGADVSLFRAVRVMRITDLDAAELDELLEMSLENVRELDLRDRVVRNDTGRVLLTTESLPKLRRLRLSTDFFLSQSMATKLKEAFGLRLLIG
jgi:uncharacterized protein (TIGR02996 family)